MSAETTTPAVDYPSEVTDDGGSWVVVVARTPAERARIARQVSALVPLIMVRSAREAHEMLRAMAGARPETTSAPPDPDTPPAPPPVLPGSRDVPVEHEPAQIEVSGLLIDTDRHVARSGSGEVGLTPLEHAFMLCLLRRPGRVWTFAELTRSVWGTDHVGSTAGNVHAVVKRLRCKLAGIRTPVSIEAIRGTGFRLCTTQTTPTIDG